jgi:hypothetical protein
LSGATVAVSNGDPVGYWGNKSGSGIQHFTNFGGSNSTRPTLSANSINGLPAINFNSQWLNSYFDKTYTGHTVFIVTRPTNHTVYGSLYELVGVNDVYIPLIQWQTPPQIGSCINTFNGFQNNSVLTPSNNPYAFEVYVSRHNGSNLINARNGNWSLTTTDTLNLSASRATIGLGTVNNPGTTYKGLIAEVIVYNRGLSTLEQGAVEYYLSTKYGLTAYSIYPIANGPWSSANTWNMSSVPLSSENVSIANFQVTLDTASTTIKSITVNRSGGILINTPTTLNVLEDITKNNGTPVISYLSAGNANVICRSVIHNYGGGGVFALSPFTNVPNFPSFLNGSTGSLNITATNGLRGGAAGNSNIGDCVIYNHTTGNINVTTPILCASQVQNGSGLSNGSAGIYNNSNGNIYLSGNVYGGQGNCPGIYNGGTANTVVINGNIYGGLVSQVSEGVNMNSSFTGTFLVNGNIYASANANGVVSSNTAARNEFTGSLINGDGGRQAAYCARYLLRPQMFNSFTHHKNTELVNFITFSEQLDNSAWTKTNTTVTANLTTSPFGALVADRVLETTTSGMHIWYPTLSNIIYTTPHVFSVYLKRSGRQWVTLVNETGNGTNGYSVIYDLTNGTMLSSRNTGTGVLSMSSIQNIGNDWYRCALGGYFTTGSGAFYNAIATSDRADYSGTLTNNHYASYSGNALSGVFAYGAQFEYGTTPTAYLSTVSTVGWANRSSQPVFYYAPESYSTTYVPHTSSVRAGTAYAAVSALSGVAVNIPTQLIGTMHVPSPASVLFNVPVESTTGTGIVNPASLQQLWSVSLDNIKTSNSLGTRLKNVATIQEVGDLLAYGSTTITPDTISGLQLWLDSTNGALNNSGSLATTSGEAIATWLDRSGNNRHATQATTGDRPTLLTNAINGKNCVFFNGARWMQGISFPNLTNYTMFAVYRRKGTPGNGSGFVFCTGVDGSFAESVRLTQLIYHNSTVPNPGYDAFGWTVKITPSNNLDIHLPRNDNFNIHSCTASLASGTAEYRLNSTGASSSISFTPVSTSVGSMIYTLGTRTWGQTDVNFMANCDIAEILVYNTTFNASQRQAVEMYLNNKWGIY